MEFVRLPKILTEEGTSFQQIENRWRPTDLLFVRQTRALLEDMSWRYQRLAEAEGELSLLDRASSYLKLLRRMRLWMRKANFTWKSDHLQFLQAVSGFYGDYGALFRLLKTDEARGRLGPLMKQGV